MRKVAFAALVCGLMATEAQAQFTGPSASGRPGSVEDAMRARPGSYIVVTGNIVSHLREEYYTFRDATGEMRVEIPRQTWQGRRVSPGTTVRLLAEVDLGFSGRYLWVKSLEVVN